MLRVYIRGNSATARNIIGGVLLGRDLASSHGGIASRVSLPHLMWLPLTSFKPERQEGLYDSIYVSQMMYQQKPRVVFGLFA